MRVSEAVNSRRSMRVFKADPSPGRTSNGSSPRPAARRRTATCSLEALDDPGQGAAAAVDGDPQGDGRQRPRAGAEYNVYPKEFTPVYDARRKLVGKQLYTLLNVPRGDTAGMVKQFRKNYDFFDAPVGMILCVERRMEGPVDRLRHLPRPADAARP